MVNSEEQTQWEESDERRLNAQLISALILNLAAWGLVVFIAFMIMD